MRDPERKRQRHREEEEQVPCREPDAELDPRTPGSCPEPKADAQPLSHPGVPRFYLFIPERHTEREVETEAEREAGSMQGA